MLVLLVLAVVLFVVGRATLNLHNAQRELRWRQQQDRTAGTLSAVPCPECSEPLAFIGSRFPSSPVGVFWCVNRRCSMFHRYRTANMELRT